MNYRTIALSFAAGAALSLLCACVSDIAYLGESYPPTYNVECFYASSDIKKPYKIMGKAIASPGVFSSQGDFMNDIMVSARTHGADAILVESFNKVKTGQTSSWGSNTWAEGNKNGAWLNESGSGSTQDVTELQAHIYFVKYSN